MSHQKRPDSSREPYSYSAKAPIRNIAAPFQSKTENEQGSPSPTKLGAFINEQNYEFVPLEDFSDVTFEKYCGPTPESNWVIPNVLLVGAYPASTDDGETFELLTSVLKLGVTKFVCLQQEVNYCVHIPCYFKDLLTYNCYLIVSYSWRDGSDVAERAGFAAVL